jgi:hypothetical protein
MILSREAAELPDSCCSRPASGEYPVRLKFGDVHHVTASALTRKHGERLQVPHNPV